MKKFIQRATAILDDMRQEGIQNPEQGDHVFGTVNKLRKASAMIVESEQFPAPGMTAAATCTLLKAGACNELTQRFLLEYLIRYKESNVNLVFLLNNKNRSSDNHVIVVVGNIQCNDGLFVGRGEKPTSLAKDQFLLPIEVFIDQQEKQTAIVDPLLDTVTSNNQADRLLAYCKQHDITHVSGVRQYNAQFIEYAGLIKANATKVAEKILVSFKNAFLLGLTTNDNAITLEVLKDLHVNKALINYKYTSGLTPLHIAFLYANIDLITQLIKVGALKELTNEAGHTAIDCLGYTEAEVIKALTMVSGGVFQLNMPKINTDRQVLVGMGYHSPWLFRKEAAEGNLAMVDLILKHAPQYLDAIGLPSKRSALHQSALRGQITVGMRLLDSKASIDIEDKDGNTPLSLAASKGHWSMVTSLIKRGANLDHPNQLGTTSRAQIEKAGKLELLKQPLPSDAPSAHVAGSIFHEKQGDSEANHVLGSSKLHRP